ncbi:hypothetical protein HYW67_03805 [Candidatus Parcubacteria bacterium]|nr:hypothetical protein [Candidatus Parcubacteria bacterium]
MRSPAKDSVFDPLKQFIFITLREAAVQTGLSQGHLNFLVRSKKLQAQKIGRNWFTTTEWLGALKQRVLPAGSGEAISLRQASRVSGYSQGHLTLLMRLGRLRGEKIGRTWITTQAWLDEYLTSVKAAATAAPAPVAKRSSFWQELSEELKALEITFAMPAVVRRWALALAFVFAASTLFDIAGVGSAFLARGPDGAHDVFEVRLALIAASPREGVAAAHDWVAETSEVLAAAPAALGHALELNARAAVAEISRAGAQTVGVFRNIVSRPAAPTSLVFITLALMAAGLAAAMVYASLQYAFAPSGLQRHLARDRFRDATIGIALVTILFFVATGQIGVPRSVLEELGQGQGLRGEVENLREELARLKGVPVPAIPGAGETIEDEVQRRAAGQELVREITREKNIVTTEERVLERQITIEPADLTAFQANLASARSDLTAIKGQLQGITGTVTSHIVTVTAPANLPTNKLLTLTGGLSVTGRATIDDLVVSGNATVGGAAVCTQTNGACGSGGSSAAGWTDDGTIVRLTTDTDLVGLGLTNPTSTLSILGSFAITPGGNVTDTFAIASTGQVKASSTVTTSNFFTATASALTTGDLFKWVVPTSGFTGNILTIQDNATTPNVFWRFGPTGNATTTGSLVVQGTNASSTLAGIFAVSSADNQVTIGTGASSTSPTLLRLGLKGDNAADPSGENGQTYYNQALGKLRCYEGGSWQNCVITTLSTAGGWTDDGTVVRLETATDSVGIGLINPTSTLSILGSFAINPGGVTDTFGIASTGQITASSTVTTSNFFTASASSLTTGDLFKAVINATNLTGFVFNVLTDGGTAIFQMPDSATATTTLNTGINIDANTLVVNANENRVGIGTQTPTTTFGVLGTSRFNGAVTVAGTLTMADHLLFSPDNTYDIGASGATRPRTGYFGTSVVIGSSITLTTSDISFSAASTFTLASAANALNFDTDTLSIDALNNRIGIGLKNPTSTLSILGSLAITSGGNITDTFAIASSGSISASSTVTGTNFFNVTATAITTGDIFKITVPGAVSGAAWTGNILTVQNNTTSINVTTPQTLLTISSTGSLTINNATTSMTIKGNVNDATNLNGAQSVFVSGRYAYVAAFSGNRLTVVDISNPSSPTVTGSVNDATNLNGAYSVFVSGRYAYVVAQTGNRLTVVDISNPSSPTVTGSVNDAVNLNTPYSVFVSGRYAYVAAFSGNRLTVVDIFNPSSPTVVGSVNDATNLDGAISVFVSGRYAYVSVYTGNRLTVVDISNPSSPTVVGSVNDATNLNNPARVFVSGRYVYVAVYTGSRLTVVDVSNPASPTVVGSVNDAVNLNRPVSVFVSGRYAYASSSFGDRLAVVDVSIPASPTVVGSVYDATNLDNSQSVFVSGRYAYVAAYTSNRLTVVELPGIDVPTVLTGSLQTTTLDTWSFANIGSDLYVRGGIVAGQGGIMTNGAFTVNATTTTAAGGTNFFSVNPYPYSANSFGFISASSSATSTTNFFTASATVLTTGDLFRGVLGAPATGNFLSFTQGEGANGHRLKLSATGLISASSTATTQNFLTASATAITSGDLFRGVLGAPATGNFLSFSQGELNTNQRFALTYQGAIQASSTVTTSNFFTASASSLTTGDLFKAVINATNLTGFVFNVLTDGGTAIFQMPDSATATTTLNTGINIDANTLIVNANENTVGVGVNASTTFGVLGTSRFNGAVTVAGGLTWQGGSAASFTRDNATSDSTLNGVTISFSAGAASNGGAATDRGLSVTASAIDGGFTPSGQTVVGGLFTAQNSITSNAVDNLTGVYGQASNPSGSAGASNMYGVYGLSTNTGTGGTNAIGVYGAATANNNITNIYGLQGKVTVTGSTNVTSGADFYAFAPSNAGTLSTFYGLYVETPTAASTNYAIYVNGGTSYFGGNVGIGITSPVHKLEVTSGSIRATSTADTVLQLSNSSGTNDILRLWDNTVEVFRIADAGAISASSTVTTSNFFTASASSLTTGDLFKAVINATNLTGFVFNVLTDGGTAIFQMPDSATATTTLNTGINIDANTLVVNANENRVGILTATPTSTFQVLGGLNITGTSDTSNFFVSSTIGGGVGVATTTPLTLFHVAGTRATSTFDGGIDVGNGMIRHDFDSGISSIENLQLGQQWFDADAGILTWVDMPVTASSTAGTAHSYTANIDGNALLTVYSESNAGGGIRKSGVGVATTTPYGVFQIAGGSGGPQFVLTEPGASTDLKHWYASTTAGVLTWGIINDGLSTLTERFRITNAGNWGIGLTNPTSTLSILGTFSATSTATVGNFFAATATSLTSGDLFKWVIPSASFTGDVLRVQTNATTPVNLFRLDNAGSIISSSTATTANFFTASATALTSGDLFRGVLGAPATADANFLSFSVGETPNNRRFALNSQGSISASSTVTGTNFFNVTATALTTGDLFNITVPGAVSGAAWTGNILTVQNNTTSLDVTTPQTLLTISSTGSLTINNATTSMTVKGSVNDDTNLNAPYSVFVSGRYAYVAASSGNRLTVVDVSNPSSPTVTGSVNDGTNLNFPTSVFVSGRYAYVTAGVGDRLTVVDISNPSSPTVVGSVNATNLDGAQSVFVSGRYAYVAVNVGDRFTVVDISNPASPTVVGSVYDATNLNGAVSVFVSGRYAYVTAVSSVSRLTVVDISNPSSPTVVGSVNDATNLGNSRSVFVSGRYAYVAAYNSNRLTVVDVSNPASPTVTGSVNDATNLNRPNGVFVSGRYAYVALDTGDRLTAVDISNPSSPTVVGSVYDATNLNGPYSVFVSGRYAYVAANIGNRLTVVELPGIDVPTVLTGSLQTTTLDTDSFANIGSDLFVRGGIVAGQGGIMTNGGFSVSATTTTGRGGTYFSIQPFSDLAAPGASTATSTNFISASSTVTVSNFFAATATSLTSGNFMKWIVPTSGLTGDILRIEDNASTPNVLFRIGQSGNATTAANFTLNSANSFIQWAPAAAGDKLSLQSGTTTLASLDIGGTWVTKGPQTPNGTPDIAEMMPVAPEVEAFDLVVADPESPEYVRRTSTPYDPKILGVITSGGSAITLGNTGFIATGEDVRRMPIVLAGRIPVKVTTENGPIAVGDRLTSSSQPGYAMKATQAGPTVGVALEPFNCSSLNVILSASEGSRDSSASPQNDNVSVSQQDDGACQGQALIFLNVGYNAPLTVNAATASSDAAVMPLPPQDSIVISASQNYNGHSIYNIAALYGLNWRLDEAGKLIAREVETDALTVKRAATFGTTEERIGLTIYDEATGAPFCIKVKDGELVRETGECGSPSTSGQPAVPPQPETPPAPETPSAEPIEPAAAPPVAPSEPVAPMEPSVPPSAPIESAAPPAALDDNFGFPILNFE